MTSDVYCSVPDCGKPVKRREYCWAHYWRFMQHGDPLAGRTPDGEPMRFVNDVVVSYTGKDCLTWPYGTNSDGYGQTKADKKRILVHRYVCELVHGAPPTPKHEAAHNCGNGHLGCVNPNHVEWKTRTENEADKRIHGTRVRGERQGRSKLTEQQVREILALRGKATQADVASKYGVSRRHVGAIQSGAKWSWLSAAQNIDQIAQEPRQ